MPGNRLTPKPPLDDRGNPLVGAALESWQRRQAWLTEADKAREDIAATARMVVKLAARLTGLGAADALFLLSGDDADAVRVLRCAGDPGAAVAEARAALETAAPVIGPGCGADFERARRTGLPADPDGVLLAVLASPENTWVPADAGRPWVMADDGGREEARWVMARRMALPGPDQEEASS